ncbi:MAG: hypothetical protein IH867_03685, partial [Chloroflexi bacterium]|nr:hypothetical protein [Chloroflexota bacterium]
MKWWDWSRGGWHVGCVDGLFDEIEYHRQKKSLEWELESLLIPEVDAAKDAGRLLADMPRLWVDATLQERHRLLTTILDAVYIDMKDRKSIVSLKAKPAFEAVVGLAGLAVPFRIRDTCPDPPIASGSMTSNPMTSL